MGNLTESEVEQSALAWLGGLGWTTTAHGPEIAPGMIGAERTELISHLSASDARAGAWMALAFGGIIYWYCGEGFWVAIERRLRSSLRRIFRIVFGGRVLRRTR